MSAKEALFFELLAQSVRGHGPRPDLTSAVAMAMAPIAERFGADDIPEAMLDVIMSTAATLITIDEGAALERTAILLKRCAELCLASSKAIRAGGELPEGVVEIKVEVTDALGIGAPRGRA